MPIFDYKCKECKDKFEHFQQTSFSDLQKCTKCGGKLKKIIISNFGVKFKGSGYYCTDNR